MPNVKDSGFCQLYAAIVLAACITGCSKPSADASTEKTVKSTPVKTVSVVQEDIQKTTRQPATVLPFYEAEIRTRVSGYVKEVKAEIGDFVEAGASLAVIDVPEMQKQKQILEAQVTRHQAKEDQAKAGVTLADAKLESAKAKLAQAQSELSQADAMLTAMEAEFNRTQDLVNRKSLESRILDEVRKKRDSAVANKQAMESAITSANAEVTVAKAMQTTAAADLKVAETETSIARKQLEELDVLIGYSTLKVPFAGVVSHRNVDPGDLVREANEVGNGQPLFVISQIDKVRVQVYVPEADAAFVGKGDTITLSFPSFPNENERKEVIKRVSSMLDPSTRTMLVEAEIENTDKKLIPGMFGEAAITLDTKIAVNILPARAIRFDEQGQAYVYVVEDDQTVTVTEVTTGADDGHSIEVTSSLKPGQKVIDAHLKRFTTGQKIRLLTN